MKKVLITLLVVSIGFNVYFGLKLNKQPTLSPVEVEEKQSNISLFNREGDTWVFYIVKEDGTKEATGLNVPVIPNKNVSDWPEEIYASLSPDGKKVAYMQKPAWPNQIFVSNVNGTETSELITWSENEYAPTHATIENQFSWSLDGKKIQYALTNVDCGPVEGGTFNTVLLESDFVAKTNETMLTIENKCSDWHKGSIIIPVK